MESVTSRDLHPPPPVTNCHTFSDPLPLEAWHTLWTAPGAIVWPGGPGTQPSFYSYVTWRQLRQGWFTRLDLWWNQKGGAALYFLTIFDYFWGQWKLRGGGGEGSWEGSEEEVGLNPHPDKSSTTNIRVIIHSISFILDPFIC